MAYTKEQMLGLTGGSNKGHDIYAASQKHGFTPDDYDKAMGHGQGYSQSWIDKNITLDKPPAKAATTAPGTHLPAGTPAAVNTAISKDPMIGINQKVNTAGFYGEGNKVQMNDAMDVYNMAVSGSLSIPEIAAASGIPVQNIQDWLTRNNLSAPNMTQKPATLDQPPGGLTAVTGNVAPNQTALSQLQDMLKSGSPYLDQAEAGAVRYANSRNMVNSSIAAGAGRAAAIDRAGPIAINDANTYSRQALANQDSQNQVNIAGAQINQSNIESIRSNETSRLNQQLQTDLQLNLQKLSDASRERSEQFRVKAEIDITDRTGRSNAFNNMIGTIGNIEGNPELNAQQKNAAIERTVGYYEEFLAYQDTLMGRVA